jgi:hypothetical protein
MTDVHVARAVQRDDQFRGTDREQQARMPARLIRSVFTTVFLAYALGGCTDLCSGIAGDQCSDNSGDSGGSGPQYHTFSDPHPLHVGTEDFIAVSSRDDVDAGEYEELALPAIGNEPTWRSTAIPGDVRPQFACGPDACIGAWETGTGVVYSIRTAGTWSSWVPFDASADWLAIAALDDGFLIATAGEEGYDSQAVRVEVSHIDTAGKMLGRWTLAKDATPGYLSVAGARSETSIGLVTWQHADADGSHAVARAQLLDAQSGPSGQPLELPLAKTTYQLAPHAAVFTDGAYHVAHDGIDGAPWFAVDPVARTIEAVALPDVGVITQLVEVPRGIALVDANKRMLSLVENGIISRQLALTTIETITATDGGLLLAHSKDGTMSGSAVTSSFDRATPTTILAERYELGGCSAGGSASLLLPMICLLGLRKRRSK